MFKALGLLFFIVLLVIIVIALAIIGGLAKLFGMKKGNGSRRSDRFGGADYGHSHSSETSEKQFSRDEGEYVDFEEIKDDRD